jgi:hypothetical protein
MVVAQSEQVRRVVSAAYTAANDVMDDRPARAWQIECEP